MELQHVNFQQWVQDAPAAIAYFDANDCLLAASNDWLKIFHCDHTAIGQSLTSLGPLIPEVWLRLHHQVLQPPTAPGLDLSSDGAGSPIEGHIGSNDHNYYSSAAESQQFNPLEETTAIPQALVWKSDQFPTVWCQWFTRRWVVPGTSDVGVAVRCEVLDGFEPLRQARKQWSATQTLVCRLDEAGIITAVMGAWESVLGLRESDLVPSMWLNWAMDEDQRALVTPLEQMLAGEEVSCEGRWRTADGRWRWMRWVSVPVAVGEGGHITYAIAQDVTDQRLAREAMEAKDIFAEFSEQLLRSAPVFCMALSPDGTVLMMNDAMLQALDYQPEEVVGRNYMTTFLPERERSAMQLVFEQLADVAQPTRSVGVVLTQDGSERLVEWHGVPVFSRDLALAGLDELAGEMPLTLDRGFDYFFAIGIDITEGQIIEQERQRLTAVLEVTTDLVAVADPDGRLSYLNRAGRDLLGIPDTIDVQRLRLQDCVPSDLAEKLSPSQLGKTLRDGTWKGESQLLHSNGQLVDVSEVLIARRDEADRIEFIATIARDISAQKQAEEALRESEERFRTLVANIPGVIYRRLADERWTLAFISEAVESLTGYRAEEFLQRQRGEAPFTWLNLLHPGDRDSVIEGIQRSLAKRQQYALEYRIVRADGEVRWVLEQGQGVFDPEGYLSWLDGSLMDITQQKEAEAELEASRQLLQVVLDNIPQAVSWKDRGLNFLGCNKAFAEMVGLANPGEIVGKSDFDMPWSKAETKWIRECDQRVIDQNQPELNNIETQTRADGTEIWLDISKVPLLDSDGEVIGVLGSSNDITERKQYEIELYRSQRQLKKQVERERLLNQLSMQIRSSIENRSALRDTIETVLHSVRQVLRVDRVLFSWYVTDTSPQCWDIVAESHREGLSGVPKRRYPIESPGAVVQRLQNCQPLRVNDVRSPESIKWQSADKDHREFIETLGLRSILLVPAMEQNHCLEQYLGLIVCCQQTESRSWTDEEVQFLQAVLNQIAIADTQTRLFTQAQATAAEAQAKARELEGVLAKLRSTQAQLVQTEKMSSLGQLVAGIAHEINNPVNFIYGNLDHARTYAKDLLTLLELYQGCIPEAPAEIQEFAEDVDLEFLVEDLPQMLKSMQVGADRIKDIVTSLRTFSRMDEASMKAFNLHDGIDSTLTILNNRTKAKPSRPAVDIVRNFGELPPVECYGSQLNQVFMNILTNAIDALDERDSDRTYDEVAANPSRIVITTALRENTVEITIHDNGSGIPASIRDRLFDPFFTTKPVGKGTGLGLSISYQIVTEKHGGTLTCTVPDSGGTCFTILIPFRQE
ncbi:MAG: PAS domain S-box protein [Cyanobacteria bacterium P01_C01_bin.89]